MADNDVTRPIRVAALCGSFRKGSYNRAALRAVQEMRPADLDIDVIDYGDVPFYDADVEAAGFPPAVARVRAQVASADAILIATPEYNYSVPGVLKNVIDWLSRRDPGEPDRATPLFGKPLGIIGASAGQFGTARAQLHLRQICVYTNLLPLNQPEVLIATAQSKFDAAGTLTDAATSAFLRQFVDAFRLWILRVGTRPGSREALSVLLTRVASLAVGSRP